MQKLIVFQNQSLDGYFVDAHGSMTWAKHDNDEEFDAFSAGNAKGGGGGVLVFGRITYDLMASFWPTPQAHQAFPVVAERMNHGAKVVFSRTLDQASWNNTKLIKSDLLTEMRRMKNEPGQGITILGSGSIVSQLASKNLIDEYQIVLNPVALGAGRTMFQGIPSPLNMKLVNSRTFRNGKVFVSYQPV